MLTWILGYFWSLPRGVSPRLEWGHACAISSRAIEAVSRFPSRGSRDLWLSLEALPRGFPTRLSHEAFPQGCPTCYSGVSRSSSCKSRQCRENRFPWNGLRLLGESGNGGTTLEFPRLSCGERLLLRCDGNAGNSFPSTQGKDPTSRARRRKRGSSGCGQDPGASSRVKTGMSRNFLSCSKGVKDPLEVPEFRCE